MKLIALTLLLSCGIAMGRTTINVKSYGAYGDGVHDDTLAIQAAINAAPNNARVYWPTGTYLCNKTSPAQWPNWYLASRIFTLPNKTLVFLGDGMNETTIVTSAAATLFDGYPNQTCQTAQNLTVENIAFQCTSGFGSSTYSFAFVFTGTSDQFHSCRFIDWTQALRGPEGQATQCGLLNCNACKFLATDGIAGIAYADPSFGYPSNAILGAGLNTELTDCVFNGLCDYSFSGVPSSVPAGAKKPLDGLIKTINQATSVAVHGCVTQNNGEETLTVDADVNGASVSIQQNTFSGPTSFQGGTCAAAINNCSGTIKDNLVIGEPNAWDLQPPNTATFSNNTILK
jgi:hypothetical protein